MIALGFEAMTPLVGAHTALYVLHSIHLKGEKAFSGEERIIYRWEIRKGRLTPLNFSYRLP